MNNTVSIGKSAEDLAAAYITRLGFKIQDRNWRFGKAEIDLIVLDQNEMVFIEVKYRASDKLQAPWMSIQANKQRRLISAANHYLKKCKWEGESRFDVISIVGSLNHAKIQHFPNAFYPVL